jgi:tetratricopeptide (TPR) repeat protein
MPKAPGLCLVSNVKADEETVLRMLESVRPLITHAVISTELDDPIGEFVLDWMNDNRVRGETFAFERVNGGQMRTRLFEQASRFASLHPRVTHLVNVDADDELETELVEARGALDAQLATGAPVYMMTEEASGHRWQFPRVFSVEHEWTWRYPLHEVPVSLTASVEGAPVLKGVRYVRHYDSNRTPAHYARHVKVIEAWRRECEENANDPRMAFYLAQSHKDAGQIDEAIDAYIARSFETRGFAEEQWFSAYEAARLISMQGKMRDEVVRHYTRAIELRPQRAESYIGLAAHFMSRGAWGAAYGFACGATACPKTTDRLFVDDSCYTWRGLDLRSIAATYLGHKSEARQIIEVLLADGSPLPECERERVTRNLEFAKE